MAVEFESPETGKVMEFPASSSSSPMPRRLRRRLSESKAASSLTVEEIEAKLRDADLRRQKFYESLAMRARHKPRSPSQSSSQEEDLGQRLEAKLQAAEQKRLSILAQAQTRLAKLDELRQAAKTGVEMRFKREKAELGNKMDLRVQQAEANRLLILKANQQRRATLRERTSQSLLRRMVRENKYKERIRAAIIQKRIAAEKKRLGLLEEEKNRARDRVLQVRKAAKYVSYQQEIERKKMKDKLEDRLLRAKRQREEYLSQKSRHRGDDLNKVLEQADNLSRKVARCWRRFVKLENSTFALANVFNSLNINLKNVKSLPFEQLAVLIESPASLQTTKSLLDRFESRYKILKPVTTINTSSSDDIDHLLKRVVSPVKRATPVKSNRARAPNKRRPLREADKSPVKLSRYQARVVLCAYMILGHPDAVLSGNGEREIALADSAEKFIQEFELLIRIILGGPIKNNVENSDKSGTFRFQLAAFDAAWCGYLNSFVMWKVKDAESLVEDLVRAACQLELSMIQTCKLTSEGDSGNLTHDMKAVQKQVAEDQRLLKDKIRHLNGDAGIQQMDFAISDTRIKYFQAMENGSLVGSPPVAHIFSPSPPSNSPPHPSVSDLNEKERNGKPNPVVRSLFQDNISSLPEKVGVSDPSSSSGRQIQTSSGKMVLENEIIVNEFLHEQHHSFASSINVAAEDRGTKSKVKEMMEKVFWDNVIDSMKQNEPKYDQVVDLMKEVRDEISEIAPQSWREEISEAIDPSIISQLLNSGKLDMDYFGKILEFALITLQKLSAPASEDEMKVVHQNLLKELAEICRAGDGSHHSCGVALIKGLRFVLEQIQVLKLEISKARLKLVEPLLRGPAGFDYMKNTFLNHYGQPNEALSALPLTFTWLSSVWESKDQEWNEHSRALSELAINRPEIISPRRVFPSELRTGGSTSAIRINGINKKATELAEFDDKYPECKGERIDLSVRLGLLKLVTGVSGLTEAALPETLKLNLVRLRSVQAEFQKILVICTSILVLRQTFVSEQMVKNSADRDNILTSCSRQLSDLFDSVEDTGIKEIIEILIKYFKFDQSTESTKIESLMNVMARMLTKSLQAGDPVFIRVSRALNVALRGVVLGGAQGGDLAEVALRQVAAAALTARVVAAAKVVVVAAAVTCGVHGEWYANLVMGM